MDIGRNTQTGSALRFSAAVMVVTGTLLMVDVALALTWGEPLTALQASGAQSQVAAEIRQLALPAEIDRRATAAIRDPAVRLAALARRARLRARSGHAIGRIVLPTLHRNYGMVEGTSQADLRKGPGHYPGTPFPGEGGTVGVAGHRTTYLAPFADLDQLSKGDNVALVMPYGRVTYRVTRTRIVLPSAVSILNPVGYEQLVLSACHPRYSASHRIVVFARFTGFAPTPARRSDAATASSP